MLELEGQIKIFEQTLNFADFRPLFLLYERSLQFGAKGHMIDIIQHDADHASREMLEPRDRDDLTELQREEKRVQDTAETSNAKRQTQTHQRVFNDSVTPALVTMWHVRSLPIWTVKAPLHVIAVVTQHPQHHLVLQRVL